MTIKAKRIIRYIYLVALGVFLFIFFIVFFPPGCMPGVHWSKNLFLSRFDCSRADICTMKPHTCLKESGGSYMPRGKDFDENAREVRSMEVCYNKDGFRDYDHPIKPQVPDTIRIEFIGSSQTYGLGLHPQDSIPQLVQTLLNQRAREMGLPYHFETFNLCLPCIYMPSMFRIYLDFGQKYNPDLVIYEYCDPGRLHYLDIEGRIRAVRHSRFLSYLMKSYWGRILVNRIFMMEHIVLNIISDVRGPSSRVIALFRKTAGIAASHGTRFAIFEYWDISKHLDRLVDGYPTWIFSSGVNRRQFLAMSYDNGNHPNESGSLYYAFTIANHILSSQDPVFRPVLKQGIEKR